MVKADEVNRRLRMPWKETIDTGQWPATLRKLWPLQYQDFDTPTLVFVGMNPAYAKAPAIVVPNSYASHILCNRLRVGHMSPDHFCHHIRLDGLEVPIFFSGMLSGQHAMDVYSKERLIHQVRKVLRSL